MLAEYLPTLLFLFVATGIGIALLIIGNLLGVPHGEREPLRGRYRGHDLVTMPPPSSGGSA